MRSMVRWILAIAVAGLSTPWCQALAAQDQTDTLVSVGTHRLHFKVFHGYGPVVLLESGGGLDATQWESLVPRLVEETGATVVTYDRAGFGLSDLLTTPFDIRQEVASLWRGLDELGLAHDLLLVGHSFGGLMIQLAAYEHQDAVLGLVFVDPMLSEFVQTIGGADAVAAIEGPPPQGPSKFARAVRRQTAAFSSTVAILAGTPVVRSIPIRVVTAGEPVWPTPELNDEWRQAHQRLASSVENGQLLVAERSGHMITETEPDIIVAVVSELLGAGR